LAAVLLAKGSGLAGLLGQFQTAGAKSWVLATRKKDACTLLSPTGLAWPED